MQKPKQWSIEDQARLLVIFEKNKDISAAMRVAARQFKRTEGSVYQKYKRVQGNKAVLLYKDKYLKEKNTTIGDKISEVRENVNKLDVKKQNPESENNLQRVMTLELKKIGTVNEQDYFLDKNNNVIIVKIVD